MIMVKRNKEGIDILYIYEEYIHKSIIIGIIMETIDREMDVAFNSRRFFLIKKSLDLIKKQKNMSELKEDINDHLHDLKILARNKPNKTDLVKQYFIVNEISL